MPTLRAWAGIGLASIAFALPPLHAETAASAPEEAPGESMARHEQAMYRLNVQHAMVSTRLLTVAWPLKPVEKLVAQKKPLEGDAAKVLTLHAQTLIGVGAPLYELEVPALHAEWNKTMGLMDRAESAGLYQPPDDLRKSLLAWRAMRDELAAIDDMPWVKGPAMAALDANLAEFTIPEGVWYLAPPQCAALASQRSKIRLTAKAALTGKPVREEPEILPPGVACLRAADRSWSASIAVVNRGHMAMDPSLRVRAEALLNRVRSRANPVSHLRFDDYGAYSEAAVRWVVPPQQDEARATARWALTNGVQRQPIGIDYAFIKFGASQQVLISSDRLRAAEVVAQIDELPEGHAKERFTPEYAVARLQQALAPLEQSLAFRPGHRYEDADAGTPRHPNTLDFLITGNPSPMEQAVKRMIANDERRQNFLLFLWDHPRYLVTIVLAVLALGSLFTARASNKRE